MDGHDPLPHNHLRLTNRPGLLAQTGSPAAARRVIEGAEAAAHLHLEGAFNLNSTAVAAWRAMLAPAVAEYRGENWTQTTPGVTDSAVFSRFTQGDSHLATGQSGVSLQTDRTLNRVIDTQFTNDELYSQGVRILERDDPEAQAALDELARSIVAGLRARGRPFGSLQELVESDLIQAAIDRTDLNAGIVLPFDRGDDVPALFAPTFLSQAEVMLRLAPMASVRSDTFRVRVYGEAAPLGGAATPARVWGEAVVRRTVNHVDPSAVASAMDEATAANPRAFEVVSFRWLNAEES